MENKSTGKTVAIVILIVLLLGAVGYIAYDKVIVKESKETKGIQEKVEVEKIENGFDISKKSTIQSLHGYNYILYISKEGEAFLTVDSYDDSDQTTKNSIEILKKQYSLNTVKGYCNTEGNLAKEICPDGDAINSIKLNISNVIAAYDTLGGQDPYNSHIIFLKNDGTISWINKGSLFNEGKIEIENNVNNLKNIVTIVQSSTTGVPSGSYLVIAIEKDGTQHILTNSDNN